MKIKKAKAGSMQTAQISNQAEVTTLNFSKKETKSLGPGMD
jgi:hypothetical protein